MFVFHSIIKAKPLEYLLPALATQGHIRSKHRNQLWEGQQKLSHSQFPDGSCFAQRQREPCRVPDQKTYDFFERQVWIGKAELQIACSDGDCKIVHLQSPSEHAICNS